MPGRIREWTPAEVWPIMECKGNGTRLAFVPFCSSRSKEQRRDGDVRPSDAGSSILSRLRAAKFWMACRRTPFFSETVRRPFALDLVFLPFI